MHENNATKSTLTIENSGPVITGAVTKLPSTGLSCSPSKQLLNSLFNNIDREMTDIIDVNQQPQTSTQNVKYKSSKLKTNLSATKLLTNQIQMHSYGGMVLQNNRLPGVHAIYDLATSALPESPPINRNVHSTCGSYDLSNSCSMSHGKLRPSTSHDSLLNLMLDKKQHNDCLIPSTNNNTLKISNQNNNQNINNNCQRIHNSEIMIVQNNIQLNNNNNNNGSQFFSDPSGGDSLTIQKECSTETILTNSLPSTSNSLIISNVYRQQPLANSSVLQYCKSCCKHLPIDASNSLEFIESNKGKSKAITGSEMTSKSTRIGDNCKYTKNKSKSRLNRTKCACESLPQYISKANNLSTSLKTKTLPFMLDNINFLQNYSEQNEKNKLYNKPFSLASMRRSISKDSIDDKCWDLDVYLKNSDMKHLNTNTVSFTSYLLMIIL